ncbi:MAG: hypothetical protein VKM92_07375 [Cyanobacteriota bacterium]|nr:hypothetical protein [Cyanobacteriota bacterium]
MGQIAIAMDDDVIPTQVAELPWSETRVNAITTGAQNAPATAVLADGSLVVVFVSKSTNDFGSTAAGNIHARRFNADGTVRPLAAAASPVGDAALGEFLVNDQTNAMQWQPSVIALADGGFFVVWSDEHLHNAQSEGYAVHGRAFAADGSPRGPQVQLNSIDAGYQWNPMVTTLASGEVVVAWISKAMAPPLGAAGRAKGHLVYRLFDGSTLLPLTSDLVATADLPLDQLPDVEFNTQLSENRSYPSLSANLGDPSGRFSLAWFAGNPDDNSNDDQLLRLQYNRESASFAGGVAAIRIDAPAGPASTREVRDLATSTIAWPGFGSPTVHAWSERTWSATNPNTPVSSIRLAFFSPGGERLGDLLTVATDASRELRNPKVLGLSDGSLIVSYTVNRLGGASAEVRLQRYSMERLPVPLAGQAVLTALTVGPGVSSTEADLVQLPSGQLVLVSTDYNRLEDPNQLVQARGLIVPELPLPTPPVVPPDDPKDPDPTGSDCLTLVHGIDNGPPGGWFSEEAKPSYPNSETARKIWIDGLLGAGARDADLVQIDFEASSGWGHGNFAGITSDNELFAGVTPDYDVSLVPAGALGSVSLPYLFGSDVTGSLGQGALLWQQPGGPLAVQFILAGARVGAAGGPEDPGIGRIDNDNDVDRGFSTTPTVSQFSDGQWLELVPGHGTALASLTIRLNRPVQALGFYLIGRESGKNPVTISLRLADGTVVPQPQLWPLDGVASNLVPGYDPGDPAGMDTRGDGTVQFIGLGVDADCSPITEVVLSQTALTGAEFAWNEEIVAIDDLTLWPVASGAPIDLGPPPAFPVAPRLHELPPGTTQGTHLRIDDSSEADRDHRVRTGGAPDWVDVQAPRTVTVEATASGRWGATHVARHSGGLRSDGSRTAASGQVVSLVGLNRFALTTTALDAASTTLVLPDGDNGFFLDDAFSARQADLLQQPGGAARLAGIDSIIMGGGSGTSIVDLTSERFGLDEVVVYGGSKPFSRCVFWGSADDDTYIARGADNDITAGAGSNEIRLQPYGGRDRLTYLAGGQAQDRVFNFEPGSDRLQLQGGSASDPAGLQLTAVDATDGSLGRDGLLSWQGNVIRLVGQGFLADQWSSQAAEALPYWIHWG